MATQNNQQVLTLVNLYIDRSYRPGSTVAETLDRAQFTAMESRKGPSDLDGRDAEYYLKARWMIAREKSWAKKALYSVGGVGLSELYNMSKGLARAVGLEKYTRTDAAVPTSPPGGTPWVQRGAYDGRRDNGQARMKPAHATSMSLWVTH